MFWMWIALIFAAALAGFLGGFLLGTRLERDASLREYRGKGDHDCA